MLNPCTLMFSLACCTLPNLYMQLVDDIVSNDETHLEITKAETMFNQIFLNGVYLKFLLVYILRSASILLFQ
jgi:hypothetical protein